jgi:Fic family protein
VDHALICSPAEKAAREAANGVEQFDYLTNLVVNQKLKDVRESQILQLQQIAVTGIYPCAGTYRDARDVISISHSEHIPPPAATVKILVSEMVDKLATDRASGVSALDRAAYALWRLNWIHPFRGGNGRTSRAITNLILGMDAGVLLPGTPSLPSLIYANRAAYVEALQDADKSLRDGADEPDLTTMNGYLRELVIRQLAGVIDGLAATKN